MVPHIAAALAVGHGIGGCGRGSSCGYRALYTMRCWVQPKARASTLKPALSRARWRPDSRWRKQQAYSTMTGPPLPGSRPGLQPLPPRG